MEIQNFYVFLQFLNQEKYWWMEIPFSTNKSIKQIRVDKAYVVEWNWKYF